MYKKSRLRSYILFLFENLKIYYGRMIPDALKHVHIYFLEID